MAAVLLSKTQERIEIDLNQIPVDITNQDDRISDLKERLQAPKRQQSSALSLFNTFIKVANNEASPTKPNNDTLTPLIKEHLTFQESDMKMGFNTSVVLDGIEALLVKHFPDTNNPGQINPAIKKKFSAQYEKLVAAEENLDPASTAADALDISKLNRAAWLSGQLQLLKELDRRETELEESKTILKEIGKASNKSSAHQTRQQDIIDSRVTVDGPKNLQFSSNANVFDKFNVKKAISAQKADVKNARKAFSSMLETGSYDPQILVSAKANVLDTWGARREFVTETARDFTHPLVRGIFTENDPTKSTYWKGATKYRDALFSQLSNNSKYTEVLAQLGRIDDEFNRGNLLQGDAVHEILRAFVEAESLGASEEKKKQLEEMQKALEGFNKDLLDKVGKHGEDGDDIRKLQMLQGVMLMSVFMPFATIGPIFDVIQPFFDDNLGIAEYLSKFFSVDGPLGQAAVVTDGMEIDQGTQAVGNLLSDPLDGIGFLVNNDFTQALLGTGGPLDAITESPLQAIAGLYVLEAVTGITSKTIKHLESGSALTDDSEKGYNKIFADEMSKNMDQEEVTKEKFLEKESKLREDFLFADKAVGWLREQYEENPEATKVLVSGIFGNKAKEVMGALETDDNEVTLTKLLIDLKAKERETGKNPKEVEDNKAQAEMFKNLLTLSIYDSKVDIENAGVAPEDQKVTIASILNGPEFKEISQQIGKYMGADGEPPLLKDAADLKTEAGAPIDTSKAKDITKFFEQEGDQKDQLKTDLPLGNQPLLVKLSVDGQDKFILLAKDEAGQEGAQKGALEELYAIHKAPETVKTMLTAVTEAIDYKEETKDIEAEYLAGEVNKCVSKGYDIKNFTDGTNLLPNDKIKEKLRDIKSEEFDKAASEVMHTSREPDQEKIEKGPSDTPQKVLSMVHVRDGHILLGTGVENQGAAQAA